MKIFAAAAIALAIGLFLPVAGRAAEPVAGRAAEPVANSICPVLGVRLDDATKVGCEWEGRTYYFCCRMCVEEFKKEPALYLKKLKREEVEDLFGAQHAAVGRMLLIYREMVRRIKNDQPIPPEALEKTLRISREFMQNFHEKLEEKYVFPRFVAAGAQRELVEILLKQHREGGKVLDELIAVAREKVPDRARTAALLSSLIQIYRPHKEREDAVLFPALAGLLTPLQYGELRRDLGAEETKVFGKNGLRDTVNEVAATEKLLGIYELP